MMIKASGELREGLTVGEALIRVGVERLPDATDFDKDIWIDTGGCAELNARFDKLLERHSELTRGQAYLLAVMEIVGYQGYLVPPELAPGVLAQLENNDRQANLD